MKYTDIMSARELPFVGSSEWRSGTAFVHASKPDHIFVTQYKLSHDVFELESGRLESAYDVRRVGRGEGGYLKRTGVNAAVATFEGAVACKLACLSATYAVNAVKREVELLYEFLRGFTGRGGVDNDFNVARPDPRIKVAEYIPQNFAPPPNSGELPERPVFTPDAAPLMPVDGIGDPRAPFEPTYTPLWFKNYYVLENGSFKPSEPIKSLSDVVIRFSFSMRQITRSALLL